MTKTALQITNEDMAVYRATARRRAERERLEQLQQTQQAQVLARQAAKLLKEKFGASRVTLFGSLARGRLLHHRSDIDLAVEGIPPRDFWRAWAALDKLEHLFKIDLIDVKTMVPRLQQEIERDGVEL